MLGAALWRRLTLLCLFCGCLRADAVGTEHAGARAASPQAGAHRDRAARRPVASAVRWLGRVDLRDLHVPRFSWSHSGFAVRFEGSGLRVRLHNEDEYMFVPVVDGTVQPALQVQPGVSTYEIGGELPPGEHVVELYRETEGQYGASRLLGIEATRLFEPPPPRGRLIEVIGDSVAAGYGLLDEEHHAPELHDGCGFSYGSQSATHAFPGLMARALDADLSVIAHSGWGVVRDLRHDPDHNVPALYDRIVADRVIPVWNYPSHADLVVIELGTNDFAAPPPCDPGEAAFVAAYEALLERVRVRHPEAWILCVVGPLLTDYGRPDVAALSASRAYIQAAIAARTKQGDARIQQVELPHVDTSITGCDWHPSAVEHVRMADVLVAEVRRHLPW